MKEVKGFASQTTIVTPKKKKKQIKSSQAENPNRIQLRIDGKHDDAFEVTMAETTKPPSNT